MRTRGRISSPGSTASSGWRSGISPGAAWCWRVIEWGRSPSFTPSCPAADWRSDRSRRRCSVIPRSATPLITTAWHATSSTSTCRRLTRSGAGCGSCRAVICWSGNRASLACAATGSSRFLIPRPPPSPSSRRRGDSGRCFATPWPGIAARTFPWACSSRAALIPRASPRRFARSSPPPGAHVFDRL